jgi:hypothetical protein
VPGFCGPGRAIELHKQSLDSTWVSTFVPAATELDNVAAIATPVPDVVLVKQSKALIAR